MFHTHAYLATIALPPAPELAYLVRRALWLLLDDFVDCDRIVAANGLPRYWPPQQCMDRIARTVAPCEQPLQQHVYAVLNRHFDALFRCVQADRRTGPLALLRPGVHSTDATVPVLEGMYILSHAALGDMPLAKQIDFAKAFEERLHKLPPVVSFVVLLRDVPTHKFVIHLSRVDADVERRAREYAESLCARMQADPQWATP
ncbi:hypothetical protein E4K72_00225 [Oxalobacteraceae bacterium OM1]|nr:hypothetical protein E4K72_00225 [Oxalobacteraceae bacterium OM1]